MKTIILFITATFLSLSAIGQSSPDEIIISFFSNWPKNSDKAIDDLYSTNNWMERKKDAIEQLKKEAGSYTVDYVGKYYGYESITKKQFSESFILYSYMVKYDRQPMRFTFEFYKPNEKWVIFNFKIDSSIDDEIEEAAKIYNLNLVK